MAEPLWVDVSLLMQLHSEAIELSGGSHGVRDMGLLESALAHPQNLFAYEGVDDLIVLAATYAVAISGNHPFIDGNKRTAFIGMGQFLVDNGMDLVADPVEAAEVFLRLAAGELDLDRLAEWLRRNVQPAG